MTEPDSQADQGDAIAGETEASETIIDDDSTVGVGSVFAIGCSLIVVLIMLGGVCYFIAQRLN